MNNSAEQEARDLMEQCGWEDAQSCSAGEVVFLANKLREMQRLREMIGAVVAAGFCPECGDGKGFIVNPLMPDGEPEQVQCMWCDHARRALSEIGEVEGE